jgi:Tol biopolymer transport system component
MSTRVLLVSVATVAAGSVSSAGAHPVAPSSVKLIDCTCYDLVVAATDRPPRTIFHNTGQNLFDVSSNRRLMAFAGALGRLYVSPTNSHAKRLLDPRFSRWAVFSPNGKRLAYGVDGCGVCIVDVAGGAPKRLPVTEAAGPVAWSPDGRRLAFVRRDGPPGTDQGTLMVASLDGSNPRALVRGSNFTGGTSLGVKLAWSPRGNRIAYLNGYRTRVHIIRLAGSHDKVLGLGYAPVWSASGRQLAFSRLNGHIVVARDDGTHLRELDPLSTDGYGMAVSWSPKGVWIAYARYTKAGRYQLAIARPDGTHRRVLTTEAQDVQIGPSYWARDGQTILYGTYLQQGE